MNISYKNVFAEEGIFLCEALPFSLCRVIAPAKLARLSFSPKTAIVFAIPYYVSDCGERNLSRYAMARDYHAYVKSLEGRLLEGFAAIHPEGNFQLYADNSPIDERHAAALSGLGVIGDNGLILTKPYGSYVFLGELLSDIPIETLGRKEAYQIKTCFHCGACKNACPKKEVCLSALTQKKGSLTAAEEDEILSLGSVWGCDLCQEVCPYNKTIEETPIAFFKSDLIPKLSSDLLSEMSDSEFALRAYAWRGRKTIERNIKLFEEKTE